MTYFNNLAFNLEYTVIASGSTDAFGDIVVAHTGEPKTDTNSGAGATTIAAFLTGTAVMIL